MTTPSVVQPNLDYEEIWVSVDSLPWCALVTTGRAGSDFFQSLLDGHPELFVFNGPLFFHEFWSASPCASYPGGPQLDDLIAEFIGNHIAKFKSHYDATERKAALGENQDQSLDIDLDELRHHIAQMMMLKPLTSRTFLSAVYVSYTLCLRQDVFAKKVFFHHIHHIIKLDPFLVDFPEARIISMTRDPRALYVSGVEHWRKFDPGSDQAGHALYVLKRTICDAQPLKAYTNEFRALKLEDLGNKDVLEAVCVWMGIAYDPCLEHSTWGGLRWWGDKLSQTSIPKNESGFSPTIVKNNWSKKLPTLDKALLAFLLEDRLSWYGYEQPRRYGPLFMIMALFLIPWPTIYERYFFSVSYLMWQLRARQFRLIGSNILCYLRRVTLFYGLFGKRISGQRFDLPFFRPSQAS